MILGYYLLNFTVFNASLVKLGSKYDKVSIRISSEMFLLGKQVLWCIYIGLQPVKRK